MQHIKRVCLIRWIAETRHDLIFMHHLIYFENLNMFHVYIFKNTGTICIIYKYINDIHMYMHIY